MKQISIVIPTYNRPDQLQSVIDNILACNVSDFSDVEIVVVDDGSEQSAEIVTSKLKTSAPFRVKYIFQENSGPARARNNGFRNATSDIVLFIDDDILVSHELIQRHIDAHHKYPGSVVTGPCPCKLPSKLTPSDRFIKNNEDSDLSLIPEDGFIRIESVVSGNLSIERQIFIDEGGLYNDSLNSPTAEEFDIIAKLKKRDIPIYMSRSLVATHLQPTKIRDTGLREYKHAIGVGELAVKYPELGKVLPEIANFLIVNDRIRPKDSASSKIKKTVKIVFSRQIPRSIFLKCVETFEKVFPIDSILFPLFRIVIGLNIYAGVLDGKKKFDTK